MATGKGILASAALPLIMISGVVAALPGCCSLGLPSLRYHELAAMDKAPELAARGDEVIEDGPSYGDEGRITNPSYGDEGRIANPSYGDDEEACPSCVGEAQDCPSSPCLVAGIPVLSRRCLRGFAFLLAPGSGEGFAAPHSRFHPVPTRPVFAPVVESVPLAPLGASAMPNGGSSLPYATAPPPPDSRNPLRPGEQLLPAPREPAPPQPAPPKPRDTGPPPAGAEGSRPVQPESLRGEAAGDGQQAPEASSPGDSLPGIRDAGLTGTGSPSAGGAWQRRRNR